MQGGGFKELDDAELEESRRRRQQYKAGGADDDDECVKGRSAGGGGGGEWQGRRAGQGAVHPPHTWRTRLATSAL
jgi:hypothetical protein